MSGRDTMGIAILAVQAGVSDEGKSVARQGRLAKALKVKVAELVG